MANGTIAASQLEMLTQTGTGIITVVPPATNTNRTLTLPDSTGTVQTVAGVLTQFNASGSAPVYACRAWVNFNGQGTVAIRASGNVSSITDNGTGDYTINFTAAMPDANYSTVSIGADLTTSTLGSIGLRSASAATTTTVRVGSSAGDGSTFDQANMNFAIFR